MSSRDGESRQEPAGGHTASGSGADRGIRAGWYLDPADASKVRWWNGASWTHHVQPVPETSPPPKVGSDVAGAESLPGQPFRVEGPDLTKRDAKDCGSCIMFWVVAAAIVWGLIWGGLKVYHHFQPERNGDERGFVAAMNALPNSEGSGVTDDELVDGGYAVCDALSEYGLEPVREFFMDGQGLTAAEAAVNIGLSIRYLCPEHQNLIN